MAEIRQNNEAGLRAVQDQVLVAVVDQFQSGSLSQDELVGSGATYQLVCSWNFCPQFDNFTSIGLG